MTIGLSAVLQVYVPFCLCSHYLFNKFEPTIFQFLLLLVLSSSATTAWLAIFAHQHLPRAFISGIILVALYLAGLGLSVAAYRISPWHPLARFPGPKLARITKLWSIYYIIRGDRHIMLEKLHHYYGPWIRVGPNEVSVNSVDALQPIYYNLQRGKSYKGIPTPGDGDTLFTLTDRKVHRERRKAWTKALSGPSLSDFAIAANARLSQLSGILREHGREKSATDLHSWLSLTLMDLIGDIGFSGGFENLASGKDVYGWMGMLQTGAIAVSILGQIPWMKDLVALLPQKGPIESFHAFSKGKVETALKRQETDGIKQDILSKIVRDHQDRGQPLTINESAADASLLIAGSLETTSQALTTIFRHLVEDQDVCKRLKLEISTSGIDPENFDPSDVESMEYLDAVVNEALRIRPPAPAGPPRTTGDEETLILDQFVPKHTAIYVPTWTLHRDPDNFRDPQRFIPERWLKSSHGSITPHNPQAFVPFSVGHGACVGRQLAIQNIKLTVIHVLSSFDIELPDSFCLTEFDKSYAERGLWLHDPFLVHLIPRS